MSAYVVARRRRQCGQCRPELALATNVGAQPWQAGPEQLSVHKLPHPLLVCAHLHAFKISVRAHAQPGWELQSGGWTPQTPQTPDGWGASPAYAFANPVRQASLPTTPSIEWVRASSGAPGLKETAENPLPPACPQMHAVSADSCGQAAGLHALLVRDGCNLRCSARLSLPLCLAVESTAVGGSAANSYGTPPGAASVLGAGQPPCPNPNPISRRGSAELPSGSGGSGDGGPAGEARQGRGKPSGAWDTFMGALGVQRRAPRSSSGASTPVGTNPNPGPGGQGAGGTSRRGSLEGDLDMDADRLAPGGALPGGPERAGGLMAHSNSIPEERPPSANGAAPPAAAPQASAARLPDWQGQALGVTAPKLHAALGAGPQAAMAPPDWQGQALGGQGLDADGQVGTGRGAPAGRAGAAGAAPAAPRMRSRDTAHEGNLALERRAAEAAVQTDPLWQAAGEAAGELGAAGEHSGAAAPPAGGSGSTGVWSGRLVRGCDTLLLSDSSGTEGTPAAGLGLASGSGLGRESSPFLLAPPDTMFAEALDEEAALAEALGGNPNPYPDTVAPADADAPHNAEDLVVLYSTLRPPRSPFLDSTIQARPDHEPAAEPDGGGPAGGGRIEAAAPAKLSTAGVRSLGGGSSGWDFSMVPSAGALPAAGPPAPAAAKAWPMLGSREEAEQSGGAQAGARDGASPSPDPGRDGAGAAGPPTPPEQAPGQGSARVAARDSPAACAVGPPVLDRQSIRAQLSAAWQAAQPPADASSPGPVPRVSPVRAAARCADAGGAAAGPAQGLTPQGPSSAAGEAAAGATRSSSLGAQEGAPLGGSGERPRPQLPQQLPKMAAKTWWLRPEDVQFDLNPDGSRVLLGEGSFGRVSMPHAAP